MKTYDKKTYDSKFLADGPIRIHPHTYYQGHGVDIVNQLNRLFMSIGKMETSTTFDGTALTSAQLASMVGSLTDGMKFKVVADGNTYYGTGSKGSEYYNIDCGDDGHVGVFYDGSGTLVEGLFSDVSAVTIGKDTPQYTLDDSALTALEEALNNKVDKVSGKGLSSNNYTTAEKTKLAGIEVGANKTTTDTSLSSSSENPIANKAVKSAIDNLQEQIEYLVSMHNNLTNVVRLCKVTVSTAEDFDIAVNSSAKSIVLGADIYTTVTSIRGKDIDLNNHALTFDIGIAKETIDIEDSKFLNGGITANRTLKLTDSTIDSTNVKGKGSNDAVIYAHGTTTIKSGTITASGGLQCGIVVYSDTNLTVENTTITASWAGITQASKNAGATVTLTETNITAVYEAVMLGSKSDQKMGTLTITGGKYISMQGTPIVAVRTNFHIERAQLESQATTQSYAAYDFENQTNLVTQSGAVGYDIAFMGTNSTTAFTGSTYFGGDMTKTVGYSGDDAVYYVRYNGTEAEKIG